MNCSVCGTAVADGQKFCPKCGTPVQSVQPMGGYQQPMGQPVQPMGGYQQPMGQPAQQMGYQQPMGQPAQQMGYQQPMGGYQQQMGYQQPMGGYQQPMGGGFNGLLGGFKSNINMVISLIGALLIFLTPLFRWCSIKVKYEYDGNSRKDGLNMFGLAGDGDIGVFAFFGIMLMLVGIILIVWQIADYFPALASVKAKVAGVPYLELIIVAVALLFIILALANGDLNDNLKEVKDSIKELKDWYDGVSGHANHGVGPIIGFIGIICAALPNVLKMLHMDLNAMIHKR